MPSQLPLSSTEFIAYHRHNGKQNPGIIFLGGFMSTMEGTKALALEAFAKENDLHFVRFDYRGHGQSSGTFEEGTIGKWKADALAVLDQLSEGPQLLIGSSMGSWLMLLLALERPERIHGLIGVASAPDFTENLIWDKCTDEQKQTLLTQGKFLLPSDYNDTPYPITRDLIEEARQHLLLNRPLPIQCPVRLLHGMADDDVPYALSLQLAEALTTTDVRVHLLKSGNHRMSSPEDVSVLYMMVIEMLAA